MRKRISQIMKIIPRKRIDVTYVVEPANWAIKSEGSNIVREAQYLEQHIRMKTSSRPYLINSKIIHFGSQFMFQNWLKFVSKDSKIIVTYFHGKLGENRLIDENLNFLISNQEAVERVIVSFAEMADRLQNYGLNPERLVKIPIGVPTNVFTISDNRTNLKEIRKKLGIPENIFLIGSFQKDGMGWGDGLDPKIVKGPDILVDTLKIVAGKSNVMVLITGPARGYVKNRLKALGIRYVHVFAKSESELVELYQILDLYIITSRDEGGPKGLLEALSTGCPVVTTPVGLATDIILANEFLTITSGFDANEIADRVMEIMHKPITNRDRLLLRSSTIDFDFRRIAELHLNKVYIPILSKG